MTKEYLNDTVIFLHENTHEIDKHWVEANLDASDITKKYQAHL